MTKKPAIRPSGHRTCTASLAVHDVPSALEFYQSAFGATVVTSDVKAEATFATLKVGNSRMFVTSGWGPHGHVPSSIPNQSSVSQHMYVEDVDAVFTAAITSGASEMSGPSDTYWGERVAAIIDPFGHAWTIATRVENLSASEVSERRELVGNQASEIS